MDKCWFVQIDVLRVSDRIRGKTWGVFFFGSVLASVCEWILIAQLVLSLDFMFRSHDRGCDPWDFQNLPKLEGKLEHHFVQFLKHFFKWEWNLFAYHFDILPVMILNAVNVIGWSKPKPAFNKVHNCMKRAIKISFKNNSNGLFVLNCRRSYGWCDGHVDVDHHLNLLQFSHYGMYYEWNTYFGSAQTNNMYLYIPGNKRPIYSKKGENWN